MRSLLVKVVYVIFAFGLGSERLKAKNDFVVTLNNDTLKGIISTNAFGGHRFQQTVGDKSKKIKLKDFTEYYSAGERKITAWYGCQKVFPHRFWKCHNEM